MPAANRAAAGRIVTCDRLPEAQARLVRAALALDGSDLKAFAETKKLGYSRLTRMVRGEENVTDSYARVLDRLVRRHFAAPARAAA